MYLTIAVISFILLALAVVFYYGYLICDLFIHDKNHVKGYSFFNFSVDDSMYMGELFGDLFLGLMLVWLVAVLWPLVIIVGIIYGTLYLVRAVVRLNTKVNKLTEK